MRYPIVAPVLSLLLATLAAAQPDDLGCGTSPENDARILALHQRPRERNKVEANAVQTPLLKEGAFYVAGDDLVTPGYRPFDLEGQSLVFEPKEGNRFAVRREPL